MENKKKIVVHSNDIAYAEFDEFEMREMKLLLSLIATVTDDKPYFYDAKEMKRIVGMESQAYSKFAKLITNLQKQVLKINLEDDKYKTYNIFSVLSFDPKNKTIEIEYNSKFIPFILNFNKNFSKYYLENVEGLNNKYAIILYLRARANIFKYQFKLSVEEIQKKYGNNYKASDIDKRILVPALTEINKFTDINITVEKEYLASGRGRSKVVGYVFKISKKKKDLEENIYKVMNIANKNRFILNSKTINKESINLLLQEYSEEELVVGLKYAYKKINANFKTLTYLKKVINSGLEEKENKKNDIDLVEDEEIVSADLVEVMKDRVVADDEQTSDIVEYTSEEEERLVNYILENDGITYDFLQNMKCKSKSVYVNTLRAAENRMKER